MFLKQEYSILYMDMKRKSIILTLVFYFFINCISLHSFAQHEIIFCGERIPVQDRFVADKLMTIIKKQINYGIVAQLRKKENEYMRTIEYYLAKTGLPADLKYLPIVESGLRNVVSAAGAAGFWQIMKTTAGDLNLLVNGEIDERNDLNKSTHAACKLLALYYLDIRKRFGLSSWVLTAAAYNNGIGNIRNAISQQKGKNYFEMNLNKETADYVYKIIALKELFEYPELYLADFGYNIFTTTKATKSKNVKASENLNIGGMTVKVDEDDGEHPVTLTAKTKGAKKINKAAEREKIIFVSARITGKYKRFKDGELISFNLLDDLQFHNRFQGKGTTIQGKGWIIDDRVLVDLGYDHNVIVLDLKNEKGIALKDLKNKELVIMKVVTPIR